MSKPRYTPEHIEKLQPGEVFVFGSNQAGRHGKGAALTAKTLFGAKVGSGFGHEGQTFAIPTKDQMLHVLPLRVIQAYVEGFLEYAWKHPELTFLVTKIGCGLAKYNAYDIGKFFKGHPPNVILPREFAEVIERIKQCQTRP
jgi:hypothetical protein